MPTPMDIVNIMVEYERKKMEEDQKSRRQEKEETEKKAREVVVQNVIDSIRSELGNDFKSFSPALERYKDEFKFELEKCYNNYFDKSFALGKIMELRERDFELWLDGPWTILKDNVNLLHQEEAKDYIRKKVQTSNLVYNEVFVKVLSAIYTEKSNGKQWLLDTIDNLNFSESIQLLKQFKGYLYELNRMTKEGSRLVSDESKEVLRGYMMYYDYACIMLNKKTNELSWNKEKNIYIDENKYNQALIYFYENENISEIKEIIKKNTYLKNKKMGNRGEEVVDYALSWLPDEYINIPQCSIGRYDQKCILLQNTEFRKEAQEYDHIIVGPQGVFIVETKNYAGEITIDEEGNWTRRKAGQEVVGERNPIQQIRRHEKLMKSIVGDVNIISIMCLSHPKVVVHGANNSPVKILKSDLLCEFVENFKAEKKLDEVEKQELLDRIKKYII